MKKIVIVSVVVLALGVAALVSFGGLGWLDSTGLRGQDRLVEARVKGYWQARVDRNLEGQVEYLHPLQGTVADSGMLVTESFEIKSVSVEGDEAVADLVVKSRLKHPILSARDRTVEMQTLGQARRHVVPRAGAANRIRDHPERAGQLDAADGSAAERGPGARDFHAVTRPSSAGSTRRRLARQQ